MSRAIIKLRRDVQTNWESVNPVLSLGEAGIETDTYRFKIGNGTDTWSDLPFMLGGSGIPVINEQIDDRVASLLIAGTGIHLSYNDSGNALTISRTAADYGSFYDTTTQTNISTTGVNTLSYNSSVHTNGISIASGNRISFSNSGVYNLQFSAQIDKTDGGDDRIDIWLSKTGVYEPWTNTTLTLHQQDAKTVAAWNFIVTANSGEYYQLHWASADANMRILAESGLTNPTRPDIPSVILTVIEI